MDSIWWAYPCLGPWVSQVASIYRCICRTCTCFVWFECSYWDLLCWCPCWGIQDSHIFERRHCIRIWFSPWNQDSWFDQGWVSKWKIPLCWSGWWKEHLGQWPCFFSRYITGSWGRCGQRYLLGMHFTVNFWDAFTVNIVAWCMYCCMQISLLCLPPPPFFTLLLILLMRPSWMMRSSPG